jgi:hypothetical protein
LPVTLQELQAGQLDTPQQAPFVQKLLWQSDGTEHGAPFGFFPQEEFVQTFGVLHSTLPAVQV